jgi:hypothetical protein
MAVIEPAGPPICPTERRRSDRIFLPSSPISQGKNQFLQPQGHRQRASFDPAAGARGTVGGGKPLFLPAITESGGFYYYADR